MRSTFRMPDIGLVFLTAVCEIAREHGHEGALWPAVRHGLALSHEAEAVLFASGHPRQALKDAIEAACVRFGLRNVIGVEGTQEWLGSVFLQLGFTRKGAVARLPEWLAGSVRPIAVSRLLENGALYSQSFAELWQALGEFRRGNLGRPAAEAKVRQSCWAKAEWCDELLDAALRRQHLGVATTGAAAREENAPTFLNGPWLVWDGVADPRWELEIAGLELLGLDGGFYRVIVGDAEVKLQRQPDGVFAYQPGNILSLPLSATQDGRVDAIIFDAQSTVVAQQEVRLFDPDADIVPFKVHQGRGTQNDGLLHGQAGVGRDHWLLIANDLTVQPHPQLWVQLPTLCRTLCRVDAAHLAQLRVCFDDGELLWQATGVVAAPEQFGSVFLRIDDGGVHGGGEDASFRLHVEAGAGVEINRVRWRGKTWVVEHGFAGPISGVEVLEAGVLQIQLRGRANGLPFFCRRELHYAKQGVLECSETGRRWGPHLNRRSVRQLARSRYRVMPPLEHGVPLSEWMLLAGDQQITRLREGRALQLREMPGYGESLRLKKGPFNAPESHTVISEVVDTGLFSYREVTPPPGALWDLALWEPLEIDGDFAVVHGVMGQEPTVVSAMQAMILTDADALLEFPDEPCDFLFLAYQGVRLGGWWREETPHRPRWSAVLAEIEDDDAARRAALAMRWGKLPILAGSARADVQEFARRHPAIVLRAWLVDSGKVGLLTLPEIDEPWLGAVRGVFRGFKPADECEALELAECLHRDPASQCERLVLDTLERLGPVDPILMGRIAREWIRFAQPAFNVRQSMWAEMKYEWPLEADSVSKLAMTMRVNDGFLDDHFLETVLLADGLRAARGEAPHQPHNLNLALSVRSFRDLLVSRIVAEIFH